MNIIKFTASKTELILMGLAMMTAAILPLNLLATQPFHHDEALYATWALEITAGDNPWLAQIPIDKPPLFLYAVAGAMNLLGHTETAARLPAMVASILTVGLTFWLGRTLYNRGVGLLAAWLTALSPFTIAFAPTAFTDPMLTVLILAGCVAAATGGGGWAGVWLGLAIATKQQGLFFGPLIAAILLWQKPPCRNREPLIHFLIGLTAIIALLFLWDAARDQSPGFWQLSLVNYGGLAADAPAFSERWQGFINLLGYGTGSPALNVIFAAGLPILLIFNLWHPRKQNLTDWLLALFCLAFVLGHAWLSFQVWDRYLLGLIPLLALLFARILLLPWRVISHYSQHHWPQFQTGIKLLMILLIAALILPSMQQPVQNAVNARYPLGSNSRALQGIEQITAFLGSHYGANNTLYHHWLGAHWRFYLWGYPYDLQYWESPQKLAVRARPGHLIAFPAWQSDTLARLALAEAGLQLDELTRSYSPDGHPAIILYKISNLQSPD
jgi:4-amino-4-deoxy-L-arabinose transferase-like glycosyltransferase